MWSQEGSTSPKLSLSFKDTTTLRGPHHRWTPAWPGWRRPSCGSPGSTACCSHSHPQSQWPSPSGLEMCVGQMPLCPLQSRASSGTASPCPCPRSSVAQALSWKYPLVPAACTLRSSLCPLSILESFSGWTPAPGPTGGMLEPAASLRMRLTLGPASALPSSPKSTFCIPVGHTYMSGAVTLWA